VIVAGDLQGLMERIEANAARAASDGRECVRVGPFVATFHPTSEMIWLNHVVPATGLTVRSFTVEHFEELRRLYREHGRVLRFEFLEALWPELGPALGRWGMDLQGRMPFMLCRRGELRAVSAPGVEVRWLSAEDDDAALSEFAMTGKRSFGDQAAAVEPQEVAELRAKLAGERYRCAVGRIGGCAAGVGTMLVLGDELAGVGTLPEYRRRGVAATVSSVLVADHFRRGAEFVWLSAGDNVAHDAYAKIGFADAGVQLNYMDRSEAGPREAV
jgi:ribosomal protein S18 acetylase RimI-like enzyme